MYIRMLKGKIHRASVTQTDLEYEGSITLPKNLMEAAGINPNEAVEIYNVTNGNRLNTYAIQGNDGHAICVNGAGAHLVNTGDIIIVAAYCMIPNTKFDVKYHNEGVVKRVIKVNEKNEIING